MVKLSIKSRKRLLVGLNILLVAAIVAGAVYMFSPIDIKTQSVSRKTRRKNEPTQSVSRRRVSNKNYDDIYTRPLRKSFDDEPAATDTLAAVSAETVRSLNLKLLGTVVEAGHTYAWFRCADGKNKLVGAGKKVDSAEVVNVKERTATVKHNGRLVTLKIVTQAPPLPVTPSGRGATRQNNMPPSRKTVRSRRSRREAKP